MNKLSNLYLKLTTGLLVGLLLSALGSLSVWLDMRIHAYLTVAITALVVCAVLVFFNSKTVKLFFVSEALVLIFGLIAGKFIRYIYDMREVLGKNVSIKTTGIVLAAVLIVVNAIAIINWKKGID
ncbi:hypothetical protein [uncultured Ezakiella sp.]|uniref:hypothetical protein n=1 Tax=uncultured Ezakiella sp. TaxID=1637529 RepID=UPI0025E30D32|nr:hypothetical protein [uncultured Ezakiella sp.]